MCLAYMDITNQRVRSQDCAEIVAFGTGRQVILVLNDASFRIVLKKEVPKVSHKCSNLGLFLDGDVSKCTIKYEYLIKRSYSILKTLYMHKYFLRTNKKMYLFVIFY